MPPNKTDKNPYGFLPSIQHFLSAYAIITPLCIYVNIIHAVMLYSFTKRNGYDFANDGRNFCLSGLTPPTQYFIISTRY